MKPRTTLKREPLERRPYIERLRAQISADIIRYAGIAGDPDEYGTDAYRFTDKPHQFVKDIIAERDRLARELTQTLAAIQVVAEGGEPDHVPDSRAFDAVVALRKRAAAMENHVKHLNEFHFQDGPCDTATPITHT